jgi:NAD(P)-dependent dehydrogenase (short-subunit alcohol dehydrogenase family)
MSRLDGRCIVITGAGRGIGRELALAALDHGAAVVATSRTGGDLDTLARSAGDRRDRLRVVVADVTDEATGGVLVDAAAKLSGGADGLVNNAGLDIFAPIWDQDDDAFDRVIATNLTAPFMLSCAFARSWIAGRRRGAIVNISSVEAELAFPEQAPYAASKGGLRQLTAVLAIEWAAAGIRVNAVAPGVIDSQMTPDRERARAAERIPLGRLGQAREVAGMVLHLLSDGASYITGTTVDVDGGFHVK